MYKSKYLKTYITNPCLRMIIIADFTGLLAFTVLFLEFKYGFFPKLGTELITAIFVIYLSHFVELKRIKKAQKIYNINRPGHFWVFMWVVGTIYMYINESMYPDKFFYQKKNWRL